MLGTWSISEAASNGLDFNGVVRSRPEAVAGIAAAMATAARGRALATGPPALLLRHALQGSAPCIS